MSADRVRIVGAILVKDGRLLLGLRSAGRASHPDVWDMIGGHVEAGECDEQAIIRELVEEIGVAATELALIETVDVEDTHRLAIFRVSGWTGEPAPCNSEHSRLGWFTPEEACALTRIASLKYREVFSRLV